MSDTVGILLDGETFRGIPKNRTGNERLALYNRAAKQLDLKPFYMTLRYMNRSSALGYSYIGKTYKLERRSIPKVTHNRTITLSPFLKRKLHQLSQSSYLFNRENRYDKHLIHKILKKMMYLEQYLPASTKYSNQQLKTSMNKYSSLFIKPTNSSVGDGIIKISKTESGKWQLHWKKRKPMLLSSSKAVSFIEKKVGKHAYMIQEEIPLATFEGRPYDLRVSVQRDSNGQWQVTGMIGKVAAKGRHVTNVAKGGTVKRVEELFRSSGFDAMWLKRSIQEVSLAIARDLSEKLPHLADIGLDIGVDRVGNIKFIEMNGRDQRYTFKKANLTSTFYRMYETPLQYAKYLLNRRR